MQLDFGKSGPAIRIVLNSSLLGDYTDEPARRHKRKRIQKKWLKRYGYKRKPDPNIYFTADKLAIMHPAIFRKFVKAFGTEEGAAWAVNNFYTGGKES